MLRWLKTVVVSDEEKAPVGGVRWGPGRRSLLTRRNPWDDIKTGVTIRPRDEPGGSPADWPGGVRREGDV